MRDELWLRCQIVWMPPTSIVPLTRTVMKEPHMTNICSVSVQTTAFIPPCKTKTKKNALLLVHYVKGLLQVVGDCRFCC